MECVGCVGCTAPPALPRSAQAKAAPAKVARCGVVWYGAVWCGMARWAAWRGAVGRGGQRGAVGSVEDMMGAVGSAGDTVGAVGSADAASPPTHLLQHLPGRDCASRTRAWPVASASPGVPRAERGGRRVSGEWGPRGPAPSHPPRVCPRQPTALPSTHRRDPDSPWGGTMVPWDSDRHGVGAWAAGAELQPCHPPTLSRSPGAPLSPLCLDASQMQVLRRRPLPAGCRSLALLRAAALGRPCQGTRGCRAQTPPTSTPSPPPRLPWPGQERGRSWGEAWGGAGGTPTLRLH